MKYFSNSNDKFGKLLGFLQRAYKQGQRSVIRFAILQVREIQLEFSICQYILNTIIVLMMEILFLQLIDLIRVSIWYFGRSYRGCLT